MDKFPDDLHFADRIVGMQVRGVIEEFQLDCGTGFSFWTPSTRLRNQLRKTEIKILAYDSKDHEYFSCHIFSYKLPSYIFTNPPIFESDNSERNYHPCEWS
jgi:hypothetical protein